MDIVQPSTAAIQPAVLPVPVVDANSATELLKQRETASPESNRERNSAAMAVATVEMVVTTGALFGARVKGATLPPLELHPFHFTRALQAKMGDTVLLAPEDAAWLADSGKVCRPEEATARAAQRTQMAAPRDARAESRSKWAPGLTTARDASNGNPSPGVTTAQSR